MFSTIMIFFDNNKTLLKDLRCTLIPKFKQADAEEKAAR